MVSSFYEDNSEYINMYAFYSAILVGKMLIMSPLTSRVRLSKKIFANSEDAEYFSNPKSGAQIKFNDDEVERVRRAHQNDLESIPPFLFISALYLLTKPFPIFAILLFRAFTLARIGHTIVYAVHPIPQPARVFCWGVGYAITFYMVGQVAMHFF